MINYLNIPKEGQIKQRILLKDLIEEASLKTIEYKYLKKDISVIYLVGVLDETTIRVPTYIDEEYVYQSIYLFHVELKSINHLMAINERLQQTFQNPSVIIFEYKDLFMISSAPKRINKARPGRSIIEGIYTSHLFKIDQQHQGYLDSMNLELIRGINLRYFYLHLNDVIYSERIIDLIGKYPTKILDAHKIKETLRKVDQLKSQMYKLEKTMKESSMMRDKMKIHVLSKDIEEQIHTITEQLKEDVLYGKNE